MLSALIEKTLTLLLLECEMFQRHSGGSVQISGTAVWKNKQTFLFKLLLLLLLLF